jgi:LacI family transcriptional regulator, galactose operon repressor
MPMSGRSTRLTSLADVAARAGVSITTASRVLSGSRHPVADATRAKVMAAASELDFEPNLLARGLVMQRTHIVGVLVHDLRDEFYAHIVRGIEDVAFANEFSIVVCETDRDPDKEIAYVRRLRSQRVDAIIYAGSSAADAEKQDEIVEQLRRVEAAGAVLLRLAPHATVEPDVSYSTHEGFGLLVDHLVELGHTEFAYVGAPAALNSTTVARHALAEVLFRNGIEFRADRMIPGDGSRAAGGEAAKQLVQDGLPVTAVLAATDHAAAGLMEGFGAHGVDVPDDISVVGFGDLTLAHDVGLTTVHVPLTEVGDTAMKRCIWYLGGGARARRDNLPLDLVVRRSCGPAPARARAVG